jgi:hypothetical protein
VRHAIGPPFFAIESTRDDQHTKQEIRLIGTLRLPVLRSSYCGGWTASPERGCV